MRVYVIIPTIGRAECAASIVRRLERQTHRPDGVVVIGVDPGDVEGVGAGSDLAVDVQLWKKGSSAQRNQGLARVDGHADIAVFFDDDYVPANDYIANVVSHFERSTDLVGVTGRLIADGAHGLGITFDDAVALVDAERPRENYAVEPRQGLYGCNMAIRLSAARNIYFDERLPLYGWQEDIDYSYRVGKNGRMIRAENLAGVHMGIKRGRTSGKRFGYSQIANPIYLLRKQTIPPRRAYRIMWRNVAMNLFRSLKPEAHVDRRGRLLGNFLAFRDLVSGQITPERVVEL